MKFAELHCHTLYSNGRSSRPLPLGGYVESVTRPERLLRQAKRVGLSAVAVTDHNTIEGSLIVERMCSDYGIVVIRAQEVDTTERGQILAYGIRERIRPLRSPQAIIKDIHDQGGVAIVAHPFDVGRGVERMEDFADADGFEICNFGAVGNKRAERYVRQHKVVSATGGSDAHHWSLVGNVVVGFPDFCETEKDYVDCLRKGECSIEVRRPYLLSMAMGGANILYSRFRGLQNSLQYLGHISVHPNELSLEKVHSNIIEEN